MNGGDSGGDSSGTAAAAVEAAAAKANPHESRARVSAQMKGLHKRAAVAVTVTSVTVAAAVTGW